MNNATEPLSPEALKQLPPGVLFYPCCGNDLAEPLTVFASYVKEFWFVDINYRTPRVPSVLRQSSLFHRLPELRDRFEFLEGRAWTPTLVEQVANPPAHQSRHSWMVPRVRTEILRDRRTGETITVNRRSGYSVACLRNGDFGPISVFFYRGDSEGEGGSNVFWLSYGGANLLDEVVSRMSPGAMLVTDGSNSRGDKTRPLRQLHHSEEMPPRPTRTLFSDRRGNLFKLVGHLGPRYGPTLAWQWVATESGR